MNKKDFNTKKIKNISDASCVKTKEELSMDIEIMRWWLYFDPILNQKLVHAFHDLVTKLKQVENFDIKEYKLSHRFIWSTARWLSRDTFDKRVKKELVQLLEDHGVYPYTT
jgi:hypothetical protein